MGDEPAEEATEEPTPATVLEVEQPTPVGEDTETSGGVSPRELEQKMKVTSKAEKLKPFSKAETAAKVQDKTEEKVAETESPEDDILKKLLSAYTQYFETGTIDLDVEKIDKQLDLKTIRIPTKEVAKIKYAIYNFALAEGLQRYLPKDSVAKSKKRTKNGTADLKSQEQLAKEFLESKLITDGVAKDASTLMRLIRELGEKLSAKASSLQETEQMFVDEFTKLQRSDTPNQLWNLCPNVEFIEWLVRCNKRSPTVFETIVKLAAAFRKPNRSAICLDGLPVNMAIPNAIKYLKTKHSLKLDDRLCWL